MVAAARIQTLSPRKAWALRVLTLLIVRLATSKLSSNLFDRPGGTTILFSSFCIKFGQTISLIEANNSRFVASQTSIPVPKVYHAFEHKGRTYIVMERSHGETLGQKWHSLSAESKKSIFTQLKAMMEQLRSLSTGTNAISNAEGGPIHDYRMPRDAFWGPFGTVSEFHLALRNDVTAKSLDVPSNGSVSSTAIDELHKLITFHESVTQPSVFTHGDLSLNNILVDDGKIVAILDWATAGWMPYYWEYTMARHSNSQNVPWQHEVDSFLQVYDTEVEMEKVRRRYFGDF